MSRKTKRQPCRAPVYTLLDVMLASATAPMPEPRRRRQLDVMRVALTNIEWGATPAINDWRVCSDIPNLLKTLILSGALADEHGALADGVSAMAAAVKRRMAGGEIRLDAKGVAVMWSLFSGYAFALESLPERTIIQCHIETEKEILAAWAGKRKSHDVEIIDL